MDGHSHVLAIMFPSLTEGFCWARTAEKQTFRQHRKYLQAVLRQDIGFSERTHGASMTSQVVSNISTDFLVIQVVLSEVTCLLHSIENFQNNYT